MSRIEQYFIEEKHTTSAVAAILAKNLMKYADIRDAFLLWLDTRNYNSAASLEIEGYTAEQIHQLEPSLDAAGVFQFMVTLREDPAKAHAYIEKGFPRK